jgi:hypothetical protein
MPTHSKSAVLSDTFTTFGGKGEKKIVILDCLGSRVGDGQRKFLVKNFRAV